MSGAAGARRSPADVADGWQLAQINVGRLVAPADDPAVAEFMDALGHVNVLAESSRGFVWRLKDESGVGATDIRPAPDPQFIVNMSVWGDADSLFQYVYRSGHTPFMARRREWFVESNDAGDKQRAAERCRWPARRDLGMAQDAAGE